MSELHSYHLVGRLPDDAIWMAPLDATRVSETLSADDIEILKYLCASAGSIPVCTIRCRREDKELAYYHAYFSETPSSEDMLAKDNALLRIIATHRNPDNPQREVERLVEDVRALEAIGGVE